MTTSQCISFLATTEKRTHRFFGGGGGWKGIKITEDSSNNNHHHKFDSIRPPLRSIDNFWTLPSLRPLGHLPKAFQLPLQSWAVVMATADGQLRMDPGRRRLELDLTGIVALLDQRPLFPAPGILATTDGLLHHRHQLQSLGCLRN